MRDSPTVSIRGQQSDDWEYLYLLLNEPAILRATVELMPYLPEDGFQDRISEPGTNTQMLVAETGQPSGRKRIVGAAWLIRPAAPRLQHSARLTFAVHPDYPGAQVPLMNAVLDLADNWLRLRRIEVTIFSDNEQAEALFRQFGFEQEVTLRHFALRDGSYHDARLLARLHRPVQAAQTDEERVPVQTSAKDTGRLMITVRGVEIDDWEDVAALRDSGNVVYHTLQLPYTSRDLVRDRLENMPKNQRGIVAVVKGQVVGQLGLHIEAGRRAHSAGLGMMVHADYQGRGIGTALMEAAVDLAENWLALSRIDLRCFTDNTAGLALYRKFGFEIEGTQHDYAFRNGYYRDVYVMSRLRDGER